MDREQPTYVEFDDNTEGRLTHTVQHDQWFAKWRAMSNPELEKEYESLLDKVSLVQNTKISKQLNEVLDLLTVYRKTRPVE